MHLNKSANRLVLALADPRYQPVIDLAKSKIEWSLPHMKDCGTPLCMSSDIDKLLIAYDSNKLVLFDMCN